MGAICQVCSHDFVNTRRVCGHRDSSCWLLLSKLKYNRYLSNKYFNAQIRPCFQMVFSAPRHGSRIKVTKNIQHKRKNPWTLCKHLGCLVACLCCLQVLCRLCIGCFCMHNNFARNLTLTGLISTNWNNSWRYDEEKSHNIYCVCFCCNYIANCCTNL